MEQRGKNVIAGITCTVAALALLLIALIAFSPTLDHSPRQNTKAYLRIYAEYVEHYRKENGAYPTTEQGLDQLVRDGFVRSNIFRDGWGNPVQYRYPSPRR